MGLGRQRARRVARLRRARRTGDSGTRTKRRRYSDKEASFGRSGVPSRARPRRRPGARSTTPASAGARSSACRCSARERAAPRRGTRCIGARRSPACLFSFGRYEGVATTRFPSPGKRGRDGLETRARASPRRRESCAKACERDTRGASVERVWTARVVRMANGRKSASGSGLGFSRILAVKTDGRNKTINRKKAPLGFAVMRWRKVCHARLVALSRARTFASPILAKISC